jgi:hypothetical protein
LSALDLGRIELEVFVGSPGCSRQGINSWARVYHGCT